MVIQGKQRPEFVPVSGRHTNPTPTQLAKDQEDAAAWWEWYFDRLRQAEEGRI